MAVFLGVDTGGTYTDAVIVDAAQSAVLGKAKALTSRPDLAIGIAQAMAAAVQAAGIDAQDVALVSLSTTLATNALVEGQGGRVALVTIGFDPADLDRAGLSEAMQGDPVIALQGGHDAAGREITPLDLAGLHAGLAGLPDGLAGVAVAGRFAVRNPAHELAARAAVAQVTGLPVTCSHELSARLNGPKRALTAVLNARLIGMIARLIAACESQMAVLGIRAPLMVVRGDGALISAAQARDRPIETILSGPAASIVGARWLTGEADALVSDIGGTTTDVCLLRGGLPMIDPDGARVGRFRTMVEAVAMRTSGLGGDSEVHVVSEGLAGGLRLGPRRLMPVALLAAQHGDVVHAALDRALQSVLPGDQSGRFALRLAPDAVLSGREAEVFARLGADPVPLGTLLRSRLEHAALDRLVARGLVVLAGVTPSDASHVLGRQAGWDGAAADKALRLMILRRNGAGQRIATDAPELARAIIVQLTNQTVACLLEAALAEDGLGGDDPAALVGHPLLQAAVRGHAGALRLTATLDVPVIGLGASAPGYYGAVGQVLGARMILPAHAGVANAIGAVVGQVAMRATGLVTSPAEGRFTAHLAAGPQGFASRDAALAALETALTATVTDRARAAGAEDLRIEVSRDLREAQIEGRAMFIEAELTVTASGRPRVAHVTIAP